MHYINFLTKETFMLTHIYKHTHTCIYLMEIFSSKRLSGKGLVIDRAAHTMPEYVKGITTCKEESTKVPS